MDGRNTFEVNGSVIIKAVQLLMDAEFKSGLAPKVTNVWQNKSADTFVVSVEREPPQAAKVVPVETMEVQHKP